MPVDQDRYNRLLASTAFDASFYTGSIQDRSRYQRAMTFVGAPTWTKINGWPALSGLVNGDGTTSANLPLVLDVTQTFSVEILTLVSGVSGNYTTAWRQTGAGFFGGAEIQVVSRANGIQLYATVYDAAGAVARQILSPNPSFAYRTAAHGLMTYIAGGGAGRCWINGVPTAVTLAGAGVPFNLAPPRPIISGGAGYWTGTYLLVRVWQGDTTNEDATCLAEQAKLLVGGW